MAMSTTRKVLLIIGSIVLALVMMVVVGIAILATVFGSKTPSIEDNSVLTLKVSGALPDYVPDDPVRKFLGGQPQSLSSLLAQLRKAKADKRISAILVDIDMSEAGWAKSEEIRDAIADVRPAKPVYCYMETGLNKDYYIATACDKIFVPPPGELFTIGLAADVMFFRGSLDKLGVYPDIYQIGKYKSAGDMFTQKQMTDAHREYINSMLDDLFSHYVNAIAQARHKSADDVRNLIDNAPYSAAQARQAGLIDDSLYHDGVEQQLKKLLGYKDSDTFTPVRAADYRDVEPEPLGLNEGERVAVIYATGDIGSGSSQNSPSGEQSIGSDTLAKAMTDVAAGKSIKAIVLRVDSPGGSGLASDIIWHAVEAANQKKPVVVSMADVAASGGYYISASAAKIVAQPSTITGSIGVVAGKPVVRGFYDWLGISNEYVLRGKNAGMFRETEKFSDDERAKFEQWIKDTYYNDFVPKVAKGRKRDPQFIDSVGQGRVWTGGQAKERGLVDDFGGVDKAIEVAKQLAQITADKGVERVILPYPQTFLQQLLSGSNENANTEVEKQRMVYAALPEDARRALRYMQLMERMKNGESIFLMPFDVRVK